MKNRRNYYRILHIQPDAPEAIIRASYRALMQKLKMHPDLGGDEWNAALLNEAYGVLTSPEQRAAYDEAFTRVKEAQRGTPPSQPAAKPDAPPRSASAPPERSACPFCRLAIRRVADLMPEDDCPGCASPLQPAARMRLEADCQRAVARMPRHAPLAFFTPDNRERRNDGLLLDLSISGLRFLSRLDLQTGQVIRIASQALAATARVTHSRRHADQGYRTGVEFITLRFHALQGTFVSEKA